MNILKTILKFSLYGILAVVASFALLIYMQPASADTGASEWVAGGYAGTMYFAADGTPMPDETWKKYDRIRDEYMAKKEATQESLKKEVEDLKIGESMIMTSNEWDLYVGKESKAVNPCAIPVTPEGMYYCAEINGQADAVEKWINLVEKKYDSIESYLPNVCTKETLLSNPTSNWFMERCGGDVMFLDKMLAIETSATIEALASSN